MIQEAIAENNDICITVVHSQLKTGQAIHISENIVLKLIQTVEKDVVWGAELKSQFNLR